MKAELKPEELRCGNTLEYFIDEDDQSWVPTQIDWQDIKWCTEEPEGFNSLHRPIELSEEWLKKAGFERNGEDKKGNEKYRLNWDDGIFDLYHIKSYYLDNGHYYEVSIKYVHQLQNLFYALTGNELIFNHG